MTFIFIGRSGCGKGTQAELLMKYLKEHDASRDIFYLESGEKFREFIKGDKYSHKLSSEIYKKDERQPDFLAVHLWSHIFIENMKGDQHVVIDGSPRSLQETKILDTAMTFYKREKPAFIYMNVSRQWSTERLLSRGRSDDVKQESIQKRLDWFDSDVMPAIEYAKENPLYNFVEINGEQMVEEVHEEIMKKIFTV